MNKLGIQCQERIEEVYRCNRKLLSVVVKSINILDPGHYARLAAENPGVELVYRQVPNGPWDSAGDGRKWAEHLYGQVGHIPEITLVEGHNEWIHAPPHNTPEDYEKADRFMVEFIDRVHELWAGRVHAIVLNASCGHFNEDIVDFFPRTLARLNSCEKCLLGLHEYDHPDVDMLGDGGHNLCGKFLRNLAGLRAAGYDRVRIALTECGVDSGVGAPAGSGHVGFKYWGEMAWARYLSPRNLGWYIPLVQETEGVAWATLYGCGMHGGWASFDIKDTHVINGIGEIYKNWTPPEPEPPDPPNNGDESMVQIYDFLNDPFDPNATTRDREWLRSIFGPDLRIHDIEEKEGVSLQPGDIIYKVQWLDCKVGVAGIGIHVEDINGNPEQGKLPVFGWPAADPHGLPQTWKLWTLNGVKGPTNENGDVGPGMGTGAYYDWTKIDPETGKLEHGPHFVWVWDLPSDQVTGIGMLTWHPDVEGNHLHVNIGYKAKVYQGEEPEPPEPPPTDGVFDKILVATEAIQTDLAAIKVHLLGEQPEPSPPSPTERFNVAFFNNVDLTGVPVHTMEEAPPFWHDWGLESPVPGKVNKDYISAVWSGTFTFGTTKMYRFNVKTDDGARLWVDNELVLDVWFPQGATLYSTDVPLTAGVHSVRLHWFERDGAAAVHLNWS